MACNEAAKAAGCKNYLLQSTPAAKAIIGTALQFALRCGKGHASMNSAIAGPVAASLGVGRASCRVRRRPASNVPLRCAALRSGRRMESRPKSWHLQLRPMRPGIPLLPETMPGRREHGRRTFGDECKARGRGGRPRRMRKQGKGDNWKQKKQSV